MKNAEKIKRKNKLAELLQNFEGTSKSKEGEIMKFKDGKQHKAILRDIAHRVMLERGLLPDFSPETLTELDQIKGPAVQTDESARDLRNLLWCSIDNDDSRDLDQL
jgi:exoribonuclease-2